VCNIYSLTEGREHPQSVPSKNERAGNLPRFAEFFPKRLGEVSSWSQQPQWGPPCRHDRRTSIRQRRTSQMRK